MYYLLTWTHVTIHKPFYSRLCWLNVNLLIWRFVLATMMKLDCNNSTSIIENLNWICHWCIKRILEDFQCLCTKHETPDQTVERDRTRNSIYRESWWVKLELRILKLWVFRVWILAYLELELGFKQTQD